MPGPQFKYKKFYEKEFMPFAQRHGTDIERREEFIRRYGIVFKATPDKPSMSTVRYWFKNFKHVKTDAELAGNNGAASIIAAPANPGTGAGSSSIPAPVANVSETPINPETSILYNDMQGNIQKGATPISKPDMPVQPEPPKEESTAPPQPQSEELKPETLVLPQQNTVAPEATIAAPAVKEVKKGRIKVELISSDLIAQGETAIYDHFKLNEGFTDEELIEERSETTEVWNELIANRLQFVSEWYDVINVVLVHIKHAAGHAIRKLTLKIKRHEETKRPEGEALNQDFSISPEELKKLVS